MSACIFQSNLSIQIAVKQHGVGEQETHAVGQQGGLHMYMCNMYMHMSMHMNMNMNMNMTRVCTCCQTPTTQRAMTPINSR